MEQRSMDQIDYTFQKLQEEAEREFRKVYKSMHNQLKKSSSQELGGELAQLEGRTLNRLAISLIENVKQETINEMIENGCQTFLTQAGWTEIQQVVGVPHFETCKVKVDVVQNDGTNKEKNISKLQKEIAQYEANKKKCVGISASGVAIVIVTLIIPEWEFPVMLATGVGTAATILGIGGAIYNEAQREQVVSKFEHMEKGSQKQSSKVELDNLISNITNSQCKHNLEIYMRWLDNVKNALVMECDKFMEMA